MKTKMLMLVMVILGTSLAYTQTPDQTNDTECNKKVLKKIKRQMNLVKFRDYVAEGSRTNVIVQCVMNENNVVEVAGIEGMHADLNAAIIQRLENHPVKCEDVPAGSEFSFRLTFKHVSTDV